MPCRARVNSYFKGCRPNRCQSSMRPALKDWRIHNLPLKILPICSNLQEFEAGSCTRIESVLSVVNLSISSEIFNFYTWNFKSCIYLQLPSHLWDWSKVTNYNVLHCSFPGCDQPHQWESLRLVQLLRDTLQLRKLCFCSYCFIQYLMVLWSSCLVRNYSGQSFVLYYWPMSYKLELHLS